MKRPPRIFIGLAEIAGYHTSLAAGFRDLGYDVCFADLVDHPFRYRGAGEDHLLVRFARFWGNRCQRAGNGPLHLVHRALFALAKLPLFLWAATNYDVFIFGAKASFFNCYDLPVLKALGKRVICIFFGSDSRPPYLNGRNYALSGRECMELARKQKESLRLIGLHADYVVDHPPTAHFHARPFIPFLRMGLPFSPPHLPGGSLPPSGGSLRILHAPSDPVHKGSAQISAVVQRLKVEGHPVELVEIKGMPNALVVAELSRCDFVIDEIHSDTAMAMFATEAAFLGKPAVVGGYAAAADWGNIPAEMIPPVLHCHPDRLYEAVRSLVIDPAYRLELGRRAREFVQSHWTSRMVAQRFLRLVEGDVPDSWLFEPGAIRYLHGWGMSEEKVKEMVRRMVEVGGREALQLEDKPHLAELFLRFAASGRAPS